jgi:broad specificity phosphatase PhoE
MTRLLLIRHGATDSLHDQIAGRNDAVHLNRLGRAQGERLAHELSGEEIAAIYSSPQPRAYETAQLLARVCHNPVKIVSELDEMDYGDWTGLRFAELSTIEEWQAFNRQRASVRIPNGELMLEVQARWVHLMALVAAEYPNESIALVSHADVIRAALSHCLGISLDLSLRLEVAPASVSVIELNDHAPRVLCINSIGMRHDD